MIADPMTLDEIKEQIIHLHPREQLQLVAFIGEHLSALPIARDFALETDANRPDRTEEAEHLIARAEAIAAQWQGPFDISDDIQAMREERMDQIWQSKS